uniref:hypothetical protein n=1 Tax=Escherichia coli TaxID=562 RepID=UPI002B24BFD3
FCYKGYYHTKSRLLLFFFNQGRGGKRGAQESRWLGNVIKILQLDYIQIIKLEPGSYKSSGLAKTELFISKECVSNIFSTK